MLRRPLRYVRRGAIAFRVCGVLVCAIASRELRAQRPVPVGVRQPVLGVSPLRLTVQPIASDSVGSERAEHAVWGAVIGGVVGAAVGYHRGRVSDARCTGECGGPAGIAPLVGGFFFGLVGSAAGAVVGYWLF
ncbi:MAG TPA: hypothetical protein VJW73_01745 [Gemmatimonadaceae bacterium]|nr:hypothetical protein [Gemmatimonadaceae bacterium]